MRIVVFKPGDRHSEIWNIEPGREAAESVVGGPYITIRLPNTGHVLVKNAYGRSRGLPPNRIVDGHVVHGFFFICRQMMDGELYSLSLSEAKQYRYNCVWPMAQGAEAMEL